MGFKSSWIACRGKSFRKIASDLALRPTATKDTVGDAEYCGVNMPRGWGVVLNNYAIGELLTERALDRAMAGCEGLVCYVNDTTMMSMATGFRDGTETWSVTHDGEYGRTHLEVEGEPPEPFAALRDELMRRSAAPDGNRADHLYDIAASLSAALTGFRHDEDLPEPFSVLRRRILGLF